MFGYNKVKVYNLVEMMPKFVGYANFKSRKKVEVLKTDINGFLQFSLWNT